jgi:hypothetical protein
VDLREVYVTIVTTIDCTLLHTYDSSVVNPGIIRLTVQPFVRQCKGVIPIVEDVEVSQKPFTRMAAIVPCDINTSCIQEGVVLHLPVPIGNRKVPGKVARSIELAVVDN